MILEIVQTAILIGLVVLYFFARNYKPTRSTSSGQADKNTRKIIVDSCGLIDGRIVELVSAGFTPSIIVIPQFILRELQLLADGNDSHKRARARFGLDVAKKLQSINTAEVIIDRHDFANIRATDDKLVELGKKISADLYTTDYNLNKVASVEGVRVLNVNELALSVRPLVLPGETLKVKVVQKGSGRGQGVGYLDDGTMVVIEHGQKLIGKTVDVAVDRYHQTDAGKMLFATTTAVSPR